MQFSRNWKKKLQRWNEVSKKLSNFIPAGEEEEGAEGPSGEEGPAGEEKPAGEEEGEERPSGEEDP